MKNQNRANAGRTQIADISVAGKELSEEHLRIVGGGETKAGAGVVKTYFTTYVSYKTCTFRALYGECAETTTDTKASEDTGYRIL